MMPNEFVPCFCVGEFGTCWVCKDTKIAELKAQLESYKRLHEESEAIAIQSTINAINLRVQLAVAEAKIERVKLKALHAENGLIGVGVIFEAIRNTETQ